MLRVYVLASVIALGQCFTSKPISSPVLHGEGPHWNAENQILYFVDIAGGTINLYDPKTGAHNSTLINGEPVTFVIPVEGTTDEFVISTGLDVRDVFWNGSNNSTANSSIIYSALQKPDGSRFNDAKVDRTGRLWAGTMGPERVPNVITERTGQLYSVTPSTGIISHLKNLLISNGLAWTEDGKTMYYIDSGDKTVDKFDFDESAWEPLSNRRTVFNFTEKGVNGVPDGMTIDTNGNLWVACYGGYQVIVIDPKSGTLLMSVPIGAEQVSSVTWGGRNLDELFVTTGRRALTNEQLRAYPDSGSTFRITGLNVKGYPAHSYKYI
ncbi:regucalcin [Orussus abietinus]|uniref:regucalcin n=1 Tax=Orussus abietinus TaxID=222816 RepID=UPI00062543F3|nr:regucalcin [Orussus abietinus]